MKTNETRKTTLPRLSREQLILRRDGEGKVVPIEVPVPMLASTVLIRPVTIGALHDHAEHLEKAVADWPLKNKVQLLREHVVEPDLSDLTEETATSQMDIWTLNQLAQVVVMYSGPLRGKAKVGGKAAR